MGYENIDNLVNFLGHLDAYPTDAERESGKFLLKLRNFKGIISEPYLEKLDGLHDELIKKKGVDSKIFEELYDEVKDELPEKEKEAKEELVERINEQIKADGLEGFFGEVDSEDIMIIKSNNIPHNSIPNKGMENFIDTRYYDAKIISGYISMTLTFNKKIYSLRIPSKLIYNVDIQILRDILGSKKQIDAFSILDGKEFLFDSPESLLKVYNIVKNYPERIKNIRHTPEYDILKLLKFGGFNQEYTSNFAVTKIKELEELIGIYKVDINELTNEIKDDFKKQHQMYKNLILELRERIHSIGDSA